MLDVAVVTLQVLWSAEVAECQPRQNFECITERHCVPLPSGGELFSKKAGHQISSHCGQKTHFCFGMIHEKFIKEFQIRGILSALYPLPSQPTPTIPGTWNALSPPYAVLTTLSLTCWPPPLRLCVSNTESLESCFNVLSLMCSLHSFCRRLFPPLDFTHIILCLSVSPYLNTICNNLRLGNHVIVTQCKTSGVHKSWLQDFELELRECNWCCSLRKIHSLFPTLKRFTLSLQAPTNHTFLCCFPVLILMKTAYWH